MPFNEFYRGYHIIKIFLQYGLDDLLIRFSEKRRLKWIRYGFFWIRNKHKNEPSGIRLRQALERLGPVWIKFGQMLSTRRDLFDAEIADQLALLQDNVPPFPGEIARHEIEAALGGPIETWFSDFNSIPLASASIAQVHTATLIAEDKDVVLKIIRPNIHASIKKDMHLMHRLAHWLPSLLKDGERLHAREVVEEYERTLLNELDLKQEAHNTLRLKQNFSDSPLLYIPKVYQQFSHEKLMVSERIYGVAISDITTLKKHKTDLKLLAERGVQTFFTQVFRDNFFHADMHPGNIFVDITQPENPRYIGIDCGIVGSLTEEDKRYLAENFLAFFNRDYRRIAELYTHSGWIPSNTNMIEFENAIRSVCEPVFAKPLAEISLAHLLINLFQTARKFNMEVQPQLVLLEKTLLYVEGLGRQLYPQLDLWTTAKPFLEKWLKQQVGIRTALKKIKTRAPFWNERFPDLPDLVFDTLRQQRQLFDQLQHYLKNEKKHQNERRRSIILSVIAAALFIGGCQLFGSFNKDAIAIALIISSALLCSLAWK